METLESPRANIDEDAGRVLEAGREQMTLIDSRLAMLVVDRQRAVHAIRLARRASRAPLINGEHERQKVENFMSAAEEGGIGPELAGEIIYPLIRAEHRITISPAEVATYVPDEAMPLDVAMELLRDIDHEIAMLVSQRQLTALAIGSAKHELGRAVVDGSREKEVIASFVDATTQGGVQRDVSHGIITRLIRASRDVQEQQILGPGNEKTEFTLAQAGAQ